jgi:hypothetical protein
MQEKVKYLTASLIMMFILSGIFAQETGLRSQSVSLFIDCEYCDLDHIKREISWVNYVREPKESDIHLLVASEQTGAGGTKVSLFFIGQKKFKGQNDTITYVNMPDDTEDIIRERMVSKIKVGLMHYIKQTPLAEFMTVDVLIPHETEEVDDKWNSWVFRLSTSGYANGSKGFNSFNIWSSVSARRITEKSKTETSVNHSYSESNFDYDNYKYKSLNRSYSISQQNVFALSDHWSAGAWTGGMSSTYSNLKFKYYFNPAIEYNIFPYKESTRKQVRINYNIGPNGHWYNDTTIYNKTEEVVWDQNLSIAAEFVQQWGRISFNTAYSNYLHDFSMNNISINTSLNLRIAKGLEFYVYAGYSIIHNQIGLPKGDVTQEELLLQQRELKTDYSFWGNAGISYTFGNLYNNVVNPRFGN